MTKVNAGACDDATFNVDTDGTLCVDSANGRIYFRYGGAWHYTAQTAGFQIPDYETEGLDVGDVVVGRLNERMADGALHGLYEKFTHIDDLNVTSLDVDDLHVAGTATVASLRVTGTATVQDITVLGKLVANDIDAKSFRTDAATIGSADKPSGITLYDKSTKEPYCLAIDQGETTKTPGICPAAT